MESSPNKRIKKVLNLMLFSLTANYFFGYSEEKNDRVMQAAINRSEANFTTEIKRLLESKRRPLPGSLLSSTNSKIASSKMQDNYHRERSSLSRLIRSIFKG